MTSPALTQIPFVNAVDGMVTPFGQRLFQVIQLTLQLPTHIVRGVQLRISLQLALNVILQLGDGC